MSDFYSKFEPRGDSTRAAKSVSDELFDHKHDPSDLYEHDRQDLSETNERSVGSAFLSEVLDAIQPGTAALSTRVASLAVQGKLHTDFNGLVSEIQRTGTPLSQQLVDRVDTMKSEGWRFWQIAYDKLEDAGLYDARAREVLVAREQCMIRYILGASGENPRTSLVGVLTHEIAHNEGLKHFPSTFLADASPTRVDAFRILAHETNAMMAEMHVETNRGQIVICREYLEALKANRLGSQIHTNYLANNPELESITNDEAKRFVNQYIKERWGEPLDWEGRVKSYNLQPPTTALAESKSFDPPGLQDHNADFREERLEAGSETRRFRLSRFLQAPIASGTIHGIKILGAVGTSAAVHSIRSSFINEGLGSALGETTRIGAGYGGFELGTAWARCGQAAGLRKALLFGFVGAYAAEHLVGNPLKDAIKSKFQ